MMIDETGADDLSYLAEFANVYKRYLTDIEFEYLLSLYPFIEVFSPDIETIDASPAKYTKTQAGWHVLDTGTKLVTGPGDLRFGPRMGSRVRFHDGDADLESGEDGGGGSLLINGITSTEEVMLQAISRWEQVIIGEGYYPLKRMAWMVALDHGIEVLGFTPSYDDYMARDSIKLAQEKHLGEIISTPTLKK